MKTVAEPKEIAENPEGQPEDSCKSWGVLSLVAAVLGAFILVGLASAMPEAAQSLYREVNGKAISMLLGGLFVIGIMVFFNIMTTVKCRKNEFKSGPAKKDAEAGAKLGKIAAIITVIGAVLFVIFALMKI